jgi:hypothetical protein
MSPKPCTCPSDTRSYFDEKGERCRECGKYRPKQEPAA